MKIMFCRGCCKADGDDDIIVPVQQWKVSRRHRSSSSSREKQMTKVHLAESRSSVDIAKEYDKAFRTPSYAEVVLKMQKNAIPEQEQQQQQQQYNNLRSPFHYLETLADYVLDPNQEQVQKALEDAFCRSKHKRHFQLMADYFQSTACTSKLCAQLLKCIETAKSNYLLIKAVLDETAADEENQNHRLDQNRCAETADQLARFMDVGNPFTQSTPGWRALSFPAVQGLFAELQDRLQRRQCLLRRRLNVRRGCRGAAVACLVGAAAAAVVGTALVACHVVAAAAAAAAAPALCRSGGDRLSRQRAQVEAAAKGAYILGRDLDTMGRLVGRLEDDVEHCKTVIGFCVQRRGDPQPLREVLRQLAAADDPMNRQMDELRSHVYMCLLTTNRARSLLFNEIDQQQQ